MDKKELDEMNLKASNAKQKTFKYKQFTVRSTFGIAQSPCCGNNCMYCVYGFKKGSTTFLKKSEGSTYDW
jgi:2-iminoacetate synthase ThiH